jgi:NADH-quinone oxidoreductase subunit C
MSETELAGELRAMLGGAALEIRQPARNNIFVDIRPEDVPAAARTLWGDGLRSRFAVITGVDVTGSIELLYHFVFDEQHTIVTLKTRVTKPFPEIESITPIIPAAEWIEREVHDLLGVKFRNHPRLERLILSDDWPEGVYPLRKDYEPKDPNE